MAGSSFGTRPGAGRSWRVASQASRNGEVSARRTGTGRSHSPAGHVGALSGQPGVGVAFGIERHGRQLAAAIGADVGGLVAPGGQPAEGAEASAGMGGSWWGPFVVQHRATRTNYSLPVGTCRHFGQGRFPC